MAEVVCNASPIILLARIDRLDILEAYATRILIPQRVLDERAARRVARTLDLKVIGTIGLVAWAKSTGLIRLAAPVLDELCRAGMRVSTPLIAEVLDLVGEPR